ncbi:hypothetical protein KQI63_06005 [bacterium]|nr:hypothetical protein [bacterium]
MMYNYTRFAAELVKPNGFPGPKAGEPLLDATLYQLDGTEVKLRSLLTGPTVIETGSLTSPSFLHGMAQMNEMARAFAHVTWLMIYVREAHPGSKIGPHGSLEDKLVLAKTLVAERGETRTVLVDDLEGSVHQAYGSLPNMVYITNGEGDVICRSDWCSPDQVRKVLLALEDDKTAMVRREHQPPNFPSLPNLIKYTQPAGWDATMDLLKSLGTIKRYQKDVE